MRTKPRHAGDGLNNGPTVSLIATFPSCLFPLPCRPSSRCDWPSTWSSTVSPTPRAAAETSGSSRTAALPDTGVAGALPARGQVFRGCAAFVTCCFFHACSAERVAAGPPRAARIRTSGDTPGACLDGAPRAPGVPHTPSSAWSWSISWFDQALTPSPRARGEPAPPSSGPVEFAFHSTVDLSATTTVRSTSSTGSPSSTQRGGRRRRRPGGVRRAGGPGRGLLDTPNGLALAGRRR